MPSPKAELIAAGIAAVDAWEEPPEPPFVDVSFYGMAFGAGFEAYEEIWMLLLVADYSGDPDTNEDMAALAKSVARWALRTHNYTWGEPGTEGRYITDPMSLQMTERDENALGPMGGRQLAAMSMLVSTLVLDLD